MIGRYDMQEGGQAPCGAVYGFILNCCNERIEFYLRLQFRLPGKMRMRNDFWLNGESMQARYFCIMFAKLLPKQYRWIRPRFYAHTFWSRPEEMWG